MLKLIKKLVREEEGQGMVEYALILGFISLAAIASLLLIKPDLTSIWVSIQKAIEGAK